MKKKQPIPYTKNFGRLHQEPDPRPKPTSASDGRIGKSANVPPTKAATSAPLLHPRHVEDNTPRPDFSTLVESGRISDVTLSYGFVVIVERQMP